MDSSSEGTRLKVVISDRFHGTLTELFTPILTALICAPLPTTALASLCTRPTATATLAATVALASVLEVVAVLAALLVPALVTLPFTTTLPLDLITALAAMLALAC